MDNFIGIVGSSKCGDECIVPIISILMKCDKENTVIVSGGAKGVDSYVRQLSKLFGFRFKEFPPDTNDWDGYKARNLQIAEISSKVYSIAIKETLHSYCYHCKSNTHDKTAGCWTANKCVCKEILIIDKVDRYG